MALTLYYHPLASYCHKVLIALYENGAPFTPRLVDLSDAEDRAAFAKVWPPAQFPVLHDGGNDRTIPESSVIIQYLDLHYPGRVRLMPGDAEAALAVRLADRIYDVHVHEPMQKIVGDRIRPAGKTDPHGVDAARAKLAVAYRMLDAEMADRVWAAGDHFSMADCAAAPALFYADKVAPFRDAHPHLSRYFGRLLERPSYVRVLKEAEPWFKMFPG